jgi:hypothetical protein
MWIFLVLIACYVVYRLLNQDSPEKPSHEANHKPVQRAHSSPYPHYSNKQSPPKNTASQPTNLSLQTFIAGIPHRLGKDIQISTILALGQELAYSREPTNRYDQNAIKLMANTKHIGYIPKEDNPRIAKHLDSGGAITVLVTSIDKSDLWRGVKIRINLH